MSPYLRTVKTSSGATAVQIVHSSRRGSRDIEHLGSAHDDAELALLKAAARQRLAAGQGVLDLGLDAGAPGGPLPITASRMGCLLDALQHAYRVLGFDRATGGDEVFRQLVMARIIEPVSKLDSARVLEEAGVPPVPYRTVTRRLRVFAQDSWRQQVSAACAAHARLGPASLVLYDVSTLYFETDTGDGFRESGFSKERRLEPQITIGLLTGADGFPLMVSAFEGNKAETKTMLPVIESFMAAHQLPDVTVVADAGMVSEANQKAIEAAGLSFILGARIPHVPYLVAQWRREHPGEQIPDGQVFTQPWPAGPDGGRRDQVIYYQYKADRARRTLRGIDEQVAKAEKAVAGKTPVKRNRFVRLSGGTRTVNRELEDKTRALAGLKGYVTNLRACPDGTPVTPEFVIGAYHQLFQIESSYRQVKTFQRGPQLVLRSASPELACQEAWAHLVVHHCLIRIIMELAAGAGIDPDRISFLKVLKHVRRSVIARTVTTAAKMTDFMDALASKVGRKPDSGPRRPRVADRLLKRQNPKYSYRDKGQRLRPTRSAPARAITLHPVLLQ